MQWLDFITGLTLMNAMPHYVLGVWKARMLSGFGLGNSRNILWGITNFLVSVGLFTYQHGPEGFFRNQIYTGAVFLLLVFFLTSPFWYRYFHRRN